jgi:hypothetical protein
VDRHFSILHPHDRALDVQRLSLRKLDHAAHALTSEHLLDVIMRESKATLADIDDSPSDAELHERGRAGWRILQAIELAIVLEGAHTLS